MALLNLFGGGGGGLLGLTTPPAPPAAAATTTMMLASARPVREMGEPAPFSPRDGKDKRVQEMNRRFARHVRTAQPVLDWG